MKKIKIREEWCLGCHLCEYHCAYAAMTDKPATPLGLAGVLAGARLHPRLRIEEGAGGSIHFAVACRHCREPLCVRACIAGALSKVDGAVRVDRTRCVGCQTCVLVCPYGALTPSEEGTMQKCELCLSRGAPACVAACPNRALTLEEVEE